ncbi:MAG: hypothetical protein DRO00_01050 [Thermoproteota archaeon]|nr:MAG: hypothetical protein DRO00_01050 [Candidatus Korarchaeota archaeon]
MVTLFVASVLLIIVGAILILFSLLVKPSLKILLVGLLLVLIGLFLPTIASLLSDLGDKLRGNPGFRGAVLIKYADGTNKTLPTSKHLLIFKMITSEGKLVEGVDFYITPPTDLKAKLEGLVKEEELKVKVTLYALHPLHEDIEDELAKEFVEFMGEEEMMELKSGEVYITSTYESILVMSMDYDDLEEALGKALWERFGWGFDEFIDWLKSKVSKEGTDVKLSVYYEVISEDGETIWSKDYRDLLKFNVARGEPGQGGEGASGHRIKITSVEWSPVTQVFVPLYSTTEGEVVGLTYFGFTLATIGAIALITTALITIKTRKPRRRR